MIGKLAISGVLLLVTLSSAPAQQPQAEDDEPPTLEERVEALERAVASLDTRLEARTTAPGAARRDVGRDALAQRIGELERAVAVLRSDVQRVDRTATAALRAAGDAQRLASSAERVARDAAVRAR